jgi:hypothetical protein
MDGLSATRIIWTGWYVALAILYLVTLEREEDVGKKISWLAFLVFASALWIVAIVMIPGSVPAG